MKRCQKCGGEFELFHTEKDGSVVRCGDCARRHMLVDHEERIKKLEAELQRPRVHKET